MKKILNDPADYVDEMLEGMIAAHPEIYAQPERGDRPGRRHGARSASSPAAARATAGLHRLRREGVLDATAIGDVFASPSAEQMARHAPGPWRRRHPAALRHYGGDVMNFDMAGEMVERG